MPFKFFPKTDTQNTGYLVFLPDHPDGSIQFFIHGIGQINNGSLSALNGLQTFINNNWPVGHWTDQISKRNTTVIFPNLLASDGNWQLSYMDDALKFAQQFSFDKTKMHLAGHSLGGQLIWGYAGSSAERGKMFASIIAVAPVYVQTNFSNIKSPVRIYVSQNDSLYQEAKSAWNQLTAANPPVKPELIPTGSDHNICGLVFDNDETWQWMLSKGIVTPVPTPAPSTLKADASATQTNVVLGNVAILDASKSTGYKITPGGYEDLVWNLKSQPEGKDTWNVFPNFNKTGKIIALQNLVPGKYVFELTAKDVKDNQSSTTVEITVTAAPAGKKIVGTATINGKNVNLFEDNSWSYST